MFKIGNQPKDDAASGGSLADQHASSQHGGSAYQSSTRPPSAAPATSESEALARDIKDGTLKGYIGNGTELSGEVNFKGMLRVDGHLSGRVNSQDGTLIVSTGGRVDANMEVALAQIYGTVNGDIIATKRIEMGRVAKVTGNIITPALVIEQGATFEGHCSMTQPKESQGGLRKEERPSPPPASGSGAQPAEVSNKSASVN